MWLKKEADVEVSQELEYSNNSISVTNAYEVEITGCRLSESKTQGSKSMSLVVDVKNEDGETNRTFFTIQGKDGNTYFESTVAGKTVKKQHFGLSIANTLFQIVEGKEIFDCEPAPLTYELYNKEEKKKEVVEGDGFPNLIGKKVGVCIQMTREIAGTDTKEYGSIEHFFDIESGLFANEERGEGKTKLDKWLGGLKDYKIVTKEAQNKSAFGAKKEESAAAPQKKGWGR